jgi:hypothetical protein
MIDLDHIALDHLISRLFKGNFLPTMPEVTEVCFRLKEILMNAGPDC